VTEPTGKRVGGHDRGFEGQASNSARVDLPAPAPSSMATALGGVAARTALNLSCYLDDPHLYMIDQT